MKLKRLKQKRQAILNHINYYREYIGDVPMSLVEAFDNVNYKITRVETVILMFGSKKQ